MKPIIVASVIVLAGLASPAFAGCGNGPSTLSQTQINTILGGNFACGRSTAANAPGWNEKHFGSSSGALVEQHASPEPVETVGTWATSTSGSAGRVTYSYGGGSTPVYEVSVVANGNCSPNCTTLPQTYKFCGVAGGAPILDILVTASLPTLASCPSNP